MWFTHNVFKKLSDILGHQVAQNVHSRIFNVCCLASEEVVVLIFWWPLQCQHILSYLQGLTRGVDSSQISNVSISSLGYLHSDHITVLCCSFLPVFLFWADISEKWSESRWKCFAEHYQISHADVQVLSWFHVSLAILHAAPIAQSIQLMLLQIYQM